MRWLLIAAGVGVAYWYLKGRKDASVPAASGPYVPVTGCTKSPRFIWASPPGGGTDTEYAPERCWDRCNRVFIPDADSGVCDLE